VLFFGIVLDSANKYLFNGHMGFRLSRFLPWDGSFGLNFALVNYMWSIVLSIIDHLSSFIGDESEPSGPF